MPLSAERFLDIIDPDGVEEYPVAATTKIWKGAAVGIASGNARPLVAGDPFVGFCLETVDNTGSAGTVRVKVRPRGVTQLPVASAALGDNSKAAVYASADDTFTKTATNNSLIGYVRRFVSSGVALVQYDAYLASAALQA